MPSCVGEKKNQALNSPTLPTSTHRILNVLVPKPKLGFDTYNAAIKAQHRLLRNMIEFNIIYDQKFPEGGGMKEKA